MVDINRACCLLAAATRFFYRLSVSVCTRVVGADIMNGTSAACNKGLQVRVCLNNGANCVGGLCRVCVCVRVRVSAV